MSGRERGRQRLAEMVGGSKVDLSRGVDLSALVNKNKHYHKWVVVANFQVEDKVMSQMATVQLQALAAQRDGEAYEGGSITIPMGQDNLVSMIGPGCAKCGLHWTADGGWGKPCKVSDDAFAEQVQAQMGGAGAASSGVMPTTTETTETTETDTDTNTGDENDVPMHELQNGVHTEGSESGEHEGEVAPSV